MEWNNRMLFMGGALLAFAAAAPADDWSAATARLTYSKNETGTGTMARGLTGAAPSRPFPYQILLRNVIAGRSIPLKTGVVFSGECGAGTCPGLNGADDVKEYRSAGGAAESPAKLDILGDVTVRGDNWADGEDAKINLGDANHYIKAIWGEGVRIGTFGVGDAIAIQQISGNVGIGTANPGNCKLAVEGTIGAREVVVTLAGWSDFVFGDNYEPPTLDQVAEYIERNKRLEGIPSEKEIASSGVSIGEMQAKLLQKIEELTLYTIELHRENRRLKTDLDDLKNRIGNQAARERLVREPIYGSTIHRTFSLTPRPSR